MSVHHPASRTRRVPAPIKEFWYRIQMALFFVLWLGFEYARPGVTRLTTVTATLDSARAST